MFTDFTKKELDFRETECNLLKKEGVSLQESFNFKDNTVS